MGVVKLLQNYKAFGVTFIPFWSFRGSDAQVAGEAENQLWNGMNTYVGVIIQRSKMSRSSNYSQPSAAISLKMISVCICSQVEVQTF